MPSGILSPLARATAHTSSMRAKDRSDAPGEDPKMWFVRTLVTVVSEFQAQFQMTLIQRSVWMSLVCTVSELPCAKRSQMVWSFLSSSAGLREGV